MTPKPLKVVLYCQIGGSLDLADFAIKSAIKNAGLVYKKEFDIVFICWKTKPEVYDWLKTNDFKYVEMPYDEGKGFLWNLYKGWNFGYEVGYQYSDIVCPIATDHAFYQDWLKNLVKHTIPNRVVCCKLIEPGILPSLHTTKNLGLTTTKTFRQDEFEEFCKSITYDYLVFERNLESYHINRGVGGLYGHRLDAMPFTVPIDVWRRFGPMLLTKNQFGTTGDTDFFDRCKAGGVQVTKALDAISYHCGGVETARNTKQNIYT